MSKAQKILAVLNSINEMANIRVKYTGIPKLVLHIMSPDKRPRHGSRVKVSNIYNTYDPDDNFVVITKSKVLKGTVKIKSSELQLVIKWIEVNKDLIDEYWYGRGSMDIDELLSRIQLVSGKK